MRQLERARVVYIGEVPIGACGLGRWLADAGHELLVACHEFSVALETIEQHGPNLVVIGSFRCRHHSYILCRDARGRWPKLPIIMAGWTGDDDRIEADALFGGAHALVDICISRDGMLETVERVLAGATLFTPDQIDLAYNVDHLTPRQCSLLQYLSESEQLDYRDAARALGVTNQTVRNHLVEIRSKLGVHTTGEAIERALRRGIVDR